MVGPYQYVKRSAIVKPQFFQMTIGIAIAIFDKDRVRDRDRDLNFGDRTNALNLPTCIGDFGWWVGATRTNEDEYAKSLKNFREGLKNAIKKFSATPAPGPSQDE